MQDEEIDWRGDLSFQFIFETCWIDGSVKACKSQLSLTCEIQLTLIIIQQCKALCFINCAW
jgi:hypothetical protein